MIDTRPDALLVPQKAVSALQSVDSVSVVKPDKTVETRQVKTGVRVGTLWVIENGLQPDDQVIVEGLQKVRPGMTVNPTVVPAEAPDTPADASLTTPAHRRGCCHGRLLHPAADVAIVISHPDGDRRRGRASRACRSSSIPSSPRR